MTLYKVKHPEAFVRRKQVFIVDDHPVTRHGMRTLINADGRYEVCGEVDSAPKALEAMGKLTPDVAIVDVALKSTNGIELTRGLRAQSTRTEVIVVSMHDENVYAERALRAGAMGYLMKQEASEKIIEALDCVLEGNVYLSPAMKDKLLRRYVSQRAERAATPIDKITDREMEVLQLLGEGFGTREIANRLKLSVKTIDSYREHLKAKLGLPTSGDLMRYAVQRMRDESNEPAGKTRPEADRVET